MAEAALKIAEPFSMSVRRVGLPDLQDKHRFLCARLKERWPHLQDRIIFGWLQGICGMNDFLFVRSERAFALFQKKQEFIDAFPIIEEVFVLAEDSNSPDPEHKRVENEIALDQAFALYDDALRWAQSLRASRIEVGIFCPFEIKDKDPKNSRTLKLKFGRLFEEFRYFANVA